MEQKILFQGILFQLLNTGKIFGYQNFFLKNRKVTCC